MSKTTIETTITPQYLRNRTKEQLIDLVLAGLDENDRMLASLRFIRDCEDDGEEMGPIVTVSFLKEQARTILSQLEAK